MKMNLLMVHRLRMNMVMMTSEDDGHFEHLYHLPIKMMVMMMIY